MNKMVTVEALLAPDGVSAIVRVTIAGVTLSTCLKDLASAYRAVANIAKALKLDT